MDATLCYYNRALPWRKNHLPPDRILQEERFPGGEIIASPYRHHIRLFSGARFRNDGFGAFAWLTLRYCVQRGIVVGFLGDLRYKFRVRHLAVLVNNHHGAGE